MNLALAVASAGLGEASAIAGLMSGSSIPDDLSGVASELRGIDFPITPQLLMEIGLSRHRWMAVGIGIREGKLKSVTRSLASRDEFDDIEDELLGDFEL